MVADYFENNIFSFPITELQSGVTCARVNDPTECVHKAECKSGGSGLICTCNTGYYDDNFSATGGQCAAGLYIFV